MVLPPELYRVTNKYGPEALIGNWFDERFTTKRDPRAITPGIYGVSDCMKDTSVYTQDYGVVTEPADAFLMWKQKAFSYRLRSDQSRVKFWDGFEYNTNMTTTNDLSYRLMPRLFRKQLAECAAKGENVDYNFVIKLHKELKVDPLRGQGNITRTDYRLRRCCDEHKEKSVPLDLSRYQIDYREIPLYCYQILKPIYNRRKREFNPFPARVTPPPQQKKYK